MYFLNPSKVTHNAHHPSLPPCQSTTPHQAPPPYRPACSRARDDDVNDGDDAEDADVDFNVSKMKMNIAWFNFGPSVGPTEVHPHGHVSVTVIPYETVIE